MKYLLTVVFIVGLFVSPAKSQQVLPLKASVSPYQPMNKISDSDLQSSLIKEIESKPQWKRLIDSKRMAIGLVDLGDPKKTKFASINGNHMMYAASLPKIAVLLTVMEAIDSGEIQETASVKKDMRLMIARSDNAASSRLIDLVGYERLENTMTSPKYKFYDEREGGGLWVGKRYGKGGATNREPLKNLSHAATVNEVCKYYYMLVHGKLVNEKRSKQMLDFLGNPELHHKFVNTLEKLVPDAQLFRKSGSWKSYHSDSVLVWGDDPDHRYILVALVDDPHGEQIIRDLVKPVQNVIRKKHRLASHGQ